MEYILLAFATAALLLIAYQDFRTREFYWFLAPVVFVLGIAKGVLDINLKYWAVITAINAIIVTITFSILFFYILATRKSKSAVKDLVGLGDVLLLVSLTGLVLPKSYIMLIFISSLLAVVFQLIAKNRFGNQIPFAGWLSVVALFFVILEQVK